MSQPARRLQNGRYDHRWAIFGQLMWSPTEQTTWLIYRCETPPESK